MLCEETHVNPESERKCKVARENYLHAYKGSISFFGSRQLMAAKTIVVSC